MEFREAEPDDADAIRSVAHPSLHVTYDDILGEDTIHAAMDAWYDEETFPADIADDEHLVYVVGERDGEIVAFSQSYLGRTEGRILWLHVHPDARGEGLGEQLLAATREVLADRGVERISGVVLADNEAGNDFYADHGFTLYDQHTIEIGGSLHAENLYHDVAGEDRDIRPIETPAGELYVDRSDPSRGREAPFYPVYETEQGTRRWGFYCDGCGSVDTAMDTMGRVACNSCGNVRKADRWDASYL